MKAVGQLLHFDVPEPELGFAVTDGAEYVGVGDVVRRRSDGNVGENRIWREVNSEEPCGVFHDVFRGVFCGVTGAFFREVVPWYFTFVKVVLRIGKKKVFTKVGNRDGFSFKGILLV